MLKVDSYINDYIISRGYCAYKDVAYQQAKTKSLRETMAEKEIPQEVLLKRLRRIEGQVRGIEKMVVDGRDCETLMTQLAAVRSATESVGALVLRNYMKLCFREGTEAELTNIDSLARAVAIWGRVRLGGS